LSPNKRSMLPANASAWRGQGETPYAASAPSRSPDRSRSPVRPACSAVAPATDQGLPHQSKCQIATPLQSCLIGRPAADTVASWRDAVATVALNLNGMPQSYRDSRCRATASVHQRRPTNYLEGVGLSLRHGVILAKKRFLVDGEKIRRRRGQGAVLHDFRTPYPVRPSRGKTTSVTAPDLP
jgi:hypothetical protein